MYLYTYAAKECSLGAGGGGGRSAVVLISGRGPHMYPDKPTYPFESPIPESPPLETAR